MRISVPVLCFLFALLGFSTTATAQSLPPLQPEQDPCNAITLCGTSFYTDSSYSGYGSIYNAGGCLFEGNSMWLRVDVVGSGNIYFTITPNSATNDYDFAIFQGTNCNSLGTPIRCNANSNAAGSNINGQVGLNATSTLTNVPGGTIGSSYLAGIAATAPSTYYILIDNASNGYAGVTPTGFTIDFSSSTAIFSGSGLPEYDSIPVSCNNSLGMAVYMNKPVLCSSIAANGSDFELVPSLATVTGATGVACAGSPSQATGINLTFSNPLPAGTYSLKAKTGTDGNTLLDVCSGAQLVGDTILFEVVTPITIIIADTTTCVGTPIQLNAQINGGGTNNSVSWSPATGLSNPNIPNPVASPPTDQSYTITVIPNGIAACSVSHTMELGVLQGFAITTPNTVLCKGQTVNLSVTGDPRYLYAWTPQTALSNPFGSNTTATPDTTTTYTLRASHTGCPDSLQSVTLTVEPVPTVDIGPDRTFCYFDTLTLKPVVTPTWFTNYSYSWQPADSFLYANTRNAVFTAYNTTNVSLTVTTPNGCTRTDNAVFTVIPRVFGTISADTGICPNDTAELRGTGAVSYRWRPANTVTDSTAATTYAFPVTSTLYTLYGTNELGCRDTQQVYVKVFPGALISLEDSIKLHPGESYRMDPRGNGLYYTWAPPLGLDDANVANPLAMPPVNTRYFVTARTENGCPATDSIDVLVDPETLLDVPNAFSPGSAPNSTLFVVRRGIATLRYFRVFDRWGKEVFQTSNIDEGWDGQYKGTPQPMGVYVYIVEATAANGRVFRKQGNVTLIR